MYHRMLTFCINIEQRKNNDFTFVQQAFVAFTKTVGKFTSLPLVIHNKDAIFANLKEHITVKDEFALESLYDLCSAFALDLQVRKRKKTKFVFT
jgi:hypothetical protein